MNLGFVLFPTAFILSGNQTPGTLSTNKQSNALYRKGFQKIENIMRNVKTNFLILEFFVQRPALGAQTKENNQLTLKCTTPTPLVLNASPDVTTP